MPYIDFNELKAQFSMEAVVSLLNLTTTKSGQQLRSACPSCKSGGDRALAITPAKSLFFCFSDQKGGDQLQLVAHIRGCDVKAAAEWLAGTSTKVPSTSTSTVQVRKEHAVGGFPPLEYLEPSHDAVTAAGFDIEDASKLGIGFAGKGIMRGMVCVPIRDENGVLRGYIGVQEAKCPPKGFYPQEQQKVVPLHPKKAG